MKIYIDSEGNTAHFIGAITEEKLQEIQQSGYREATAEELQQVEAARQAIQTIKDELTLIYNSASRLQKAQYEPVRVEAEKLINQGDFQELELLLIEAKDGLPDNAKQIAQAIYNKYIEIKGEK